MFIHTIGVETHMGESASGEVFAERVNVKGFISENEAVKNNGASQELTSGDAGGESHVYTFLKHAHLFTPKSKVYLSHRTSQVFKIRFQDGGSMGLPDHIDVLIV